MSKHELIKELLQHELNLFRFSIWATFNSDGDLEYALCLSGSKPFGYDINLCKIGGISDFNYTYDYIDFMIDDALDRYYERL